MKVILTLLVAIVVVVVVVGCDRGSKENKVPAAPAPVVVVPPPVVVADETRSDCEVKFDGNEKLSEIAVKANLMRAKCGMSENDILMKVE